MIKFLVVAVLSAVACYADYSVRVPEAPLIETSAPLVGDDEIKIVQELIETTTRQLEMQKQLKIQMLDFKKQREEFVQGDHSKSRSVRMVRTARQIYEMISSQHLQHLFQKDYLEELSFFSSIAGKNAPTRP